MPEDPSGESPQFPAITAVFAAEAAVALLDHKAAMSKLILRLLKKGPLSLEVQEDKKTTGSQKNLASVMLHGGRHGL